MMELIEFTNDELVHVKIIDDQHREIAVMINEIHKNVLNNNKTLVKDSLLKLIELLEIHFETEERLMKENRYPGYITHKLEHDRFYNKTVTTLDQYKKNEILLGLDQLDSLRRWFYNHIEINDRKCANHLISLGIS